MEFRGQPAHVPRGRHDKRERSAREQRTSPYVSGISGVLFDLDNTLISHTRYLAVVTLAFLEAHVKPTS